MVCHFKAEIHDLDNSISYVENKMGEFASHFNELVDAHSEHKGDVEWIKAKLAALEDRSRQNN